MCVYATFSQLAIFTICSEYNRIYVDGAPMHTHWYNSKVEKMRLQLQDTCRFSPHFTAHFTGIDFLSIHWYIHSLRGFFFPISFCTNSTEEKKIRNQWPLCNLDGYSWSIGLNYYMNVLCFYTKFCLIFHRNTNSLNIRESILFINTCSINNEHELETRSTMEIFPQTTKIKFTLCNSCWFDEGK